LPSQVKLVVYKNRIRLREFFVDYDKLRTGYVTEGQFMSGLTSAGLKLAAREMKALADKYKDPENPQQKVHYRYVFLERTLRERSTGHKQDVQYDFVWDWYAAETVTRVKERVSAVNCYEHLENGAVFRISASLGCWRRGGSRVQN
jgi:hypothetical protein